jgi:hypothetical protein
VPSETQSDQSKPIDRGRLSTMIDKLVAVQMDLKPLCEDGGNTITNPRDRATITEACAVLESAIDDLKQVIFNLEGVPGVVQSLRSSKASGPE